MARTKKRARINPPAREPAGRLSRALTAEIGDTSPAKIRRLREEALRRTSDPEWGWEVGRLYLEGRIRADQMAAAKRWRALVTRWRVSYGIPPPTTKPLSLFLTAQSPPVDPDSPKGIREAERARDLLEALRPASDALDGLGPDVARTVRHVVEDDCVPIGTEDEQRLRAGLDALSAHWGMRTG